MIIVYEARYINKRSLPHSSITSAERTGELLSYTRLLTAMKLTDAAEKWWEMRMM